MHRELSRRSVLRAVASAAAMASAGPVFGGSPAPVSRPNIIFLLADDLRYDAVGYVNRKVRTPNLDSLARDGLRFHNAFVTTSICAISRASIFTGMYARRHQICDFLTPLSADLLTLSYPVLLRSAGYRTGFFGKYGVGDVIIDASGKILDAQLPQQDRAGFDVIEDYGFSYYLDGDTQEGDHIHSILANRAENFILSSSEKQPFCLSLSFVSPHERRPLPGYDVADHVMPAELAMPAEPDVLALYKNSFFPETPLTNDACFRSLPGFIRNSLARTRWLKTLSDPKKRLDYLRRYYALITGLDRVVGRVLQALETVDAASNTAVIFTSDNGYFLGDYQLHDKWFGYESSIRVPLLIRPPGKPVSRDITAIALNIDLAPTLLGLAGVPIPERAQGRDLSALWTGRSLYPWRADFLYEHFLCNPLGQPDSRSEKSIPSSEGVRNERYTYLRYPHQKGDNETLFDRMADPGQVKNIIRSAPRKLIDQIRKRTDELIAMSA